MQKNNDVPWDELKNQYYHHLRTLQDALAVVNNSTFELNRIYTEVIKKIQRHVSGHDERICRLVDQTNQHKKY